MTALRGKLAERRAVRSWIADRQRASHNASSWTFLVRALKILARDPSADAAQLVADIQARVPEEYRTP